MKFTLFSFHHFDIRRYPYDRYDRRWWLIQPDPTWTNLSTTSTIEQSSDYAVPLAIMQTAVQAVSNTTFDSGVGKAAAAASSSNNTLIVTGQYTAPMEFMVFMHFADFQNNPLALRQFTVSVNEQESFQLRPSYLLTDTLHNSVWYKAPDGVFTMTLTATSKSVLPPMLNAFEVYTVISHDSPMTLPGDCKHSLPHYI